MTFRKLSWFGGLLLGLASVAGAQEKQGTVYRSPSGATLRLVLDSTNVGKEISVGELTFPPNSDSGDHQHGAIEIFYVLSGELEHVVNGKSQILKPGMVGYVRPPTHIGTRSCTAHGSIRKPENS